VLTAHGLWWGNGRLAIWCEDQAEDHGTGARSGQPARHPFALDAARLRAELAADGVRGPGEAAELALVLPARGGRPRAVAAWTRPGASRPGAADDGTFVVAALVVEAPGWVDALRALADRPGQAIRAGASIALLAAAADHALGLVAAGAVLPSLEAGPDGRFRARWTSVPATGTDDVVDALATHPGATWRLLAAEHRRGPRHRRPGAAVIVASIAADMVDALCRSGFSADGLELGEPESPADALGASTELVRSWISALGPAGPELTPAVGAEGPGEVHRLAEVLGRWQAPARRAEPEWRLCFRLCEPEDHGAAGSEASAAADAWRVDLFLQALDDPSLVVRADEVWRSGPSLQRAARTVVAPPTALLGELGRAIRAEPAVAGVLDVPAPVSFELDAEGAHRFLEATAGRLGESGFGVWLPSWWRTGPPVTLRLRTGAPRPGPGAPPAGLHAQALCRFDWQVAVGGEVLTEDELRSLAGLKVPLVRVRGRWMEHDPATLDRVLRFVERERRTPTPTTASAVVGVAAGTRQVLPGVPVDSVDAQGEVGDLLAGRLGERPGPVEAPGFAGRLRPYQRRGVEWLAAMDRLGLGACLADDMGLGKTAMVLALEAHERSAPGAGGPTLVVCPTSVVQNWCHEAERFTPALRTVVHHGAGRHRRAGEAAFEEVDLVLTSYAVVARDRSLLEAVAWRRLVLDEAQNVKNPAARQTAAVRALSARHRIALTGTPVENHLGDLWSIMDVINPGLLGSAEAFRDRFAAPIDRDDAAAAERLRRVTGPLILRRLKTDRRVISDLPEKIEMTEHCSLTREQATLYQAVVEEMLATIEGTAGMARRGHVLATLLRLKQICNHPAHYLADGSRLAGRSGKLERTVELLEAVLAVDERAIVFTQFSQMGRLLTDHLEARLGAPVGFLHGGLDRSRRGALVERFQRGALAVLVLSLRAGGSGLNLTAANHVVHFDRWWNPAVEAQATDRAFRIGQSRRVQVRTLVCAGTVEERVAEVMERKGRLADLVVGEGARWMTELATDRLAELFALAAPASAAA
jgi:non-specific serine/threonine protein kinase